MSGYAQDSPTGSCAWSRTLLAGVGGVTIGLMAVGRGVRQQR